MLNLVINNGKILEYKSLSVVKSIDNICGGFEVILDSKKQIGASLWESSGCAINIDGIPILAGFFDQFIGKTSRKDEDIVLRGRDKTSFVVDSDLSVKNTTATGKDNKVYLVSFLKEMLKKNDLDFIDVINNTFPQENLSMSKDSITADIGDNIFNIIQKYCYFNKVVCTSDFNGNISLERAGRFKTQTSLLLLDKLNSSNNIINSDVNFDLTKRYGKYIVMCEGSSGLDSVIDDVSSGELGWESISGKNTYTNGFAIDKEISLNKKKVILLNKEATPEECTAMAVWEMNLAKKRSFSYNCVLAGYKDNKGYPWRPNTLVAVNDTKYGISGQMLITSVRFISSRETGYTTELSLTYPESFSLLLKPEKKKSGKGDSEFFLVAEDKVFYNAGDIPVRKYKEEYWEATVGKSNKETIAKRNSGSIV